MKRICLVIFVAAVSCKQSYVSPARSSANGNLVVEGFINNGPDSTMFRLTQTFDLSDTAHATPELNAQVTVEGNDNSSFVLPEAGNGYYGDSLVGLSNSVLYRLHIHTSGGKEYASDYVTMKASPPIDSANWVRTADGVQFYVNTHDPQNATHYYRWDYREVWEIRASYFASLQFVNDSIIPLSPNNMYNCWQSDVSDQIFLGSTDQLSQDIIYHTAIAFVPNADRKISVEYSIQVRQYALSKEAFQWWQTLQKNTEQIGTIFGVQPAANKGNVHNLADTTEQVIGYVSGGTMQTQRVFIVHDQVEPWNFELMCDSLMIVPPSRVAYLYDRGYRIIGAEGFGGPMYSLSSAYCVDCTLQGSNKRPPFWQ